jgi:Cu2+-exporting ATPase
MQVFRQGRFRVRITGVERACPASQALLDWLAARTEVLSIKRRADASVLGVDYQEQDCLPGRFVRALVDKISALERAFEQRFSVEISSAAAGRVRFRVKDLASCELARLAKWAATLKGVSSATAAPSTESLLVTYHPQKTCAERLLTALRKSDPATWPKASDAPEQTQLGGTLSASAVLAACVTRSLPASLLVSGILVHAWPPLRRSVTALNQGRVSVDLLDVVGTGAALATGQLGTAAFIVWMVGIGDLLLELSAKRASNAISKLMCMEVKEAFRINPDGSTECVAVDRLAPGDRILVETGQSIAADGTCLSGVAMVDEKALTGESQLLEKRAGDKVLAATFIVEGQLVIAVERTGARTAAAQALQIVQNAGKKPLTLQRDALDTASRLVLPTFGAAGLAALWASRIERAVSVVITDFGAGIRVAVPTIALVAMTRAARQGILIKGAQYFERLEKADVIAIDKTGTLTEGEPEIVEVVTAPEFTAPTLISLCAGAEARHSHPIARALRSYAEKLRLKTSTPELGSEEYVVGCGLSGCVEGHRVLIGSRRWLEEKAVNTAAFAEVLQRLQQQRVSALCVAVDGQPAGVIGYADAIRPESYIVVRDLKAQGRRRVLLLSGDSMGPVKAVAQAVHVDEAHEGLLPEQKAFRVKHLRDDGRVVAMVGDGINDAPALAVADIGISIASGTAAAVETADVVLLQGGLSQLADMLALS